jgi:hypothetical protein
MAQSYVWSAFKAGLVRLRGLLLPLLLQPPSPECPLANSPSGPGCLTEARGRSMVSVFPKTLSNDQLTSVHTHT